MELVKRFRIRNNLGLHARAAAKIVALGNQFDSNLFLHKDGKEADGSNILSIIALECPKGTEMEARIVGEDAEDFMQKLSELFDKRFGEDR
ncbi:MAG: HPr family phosphocarrier protein [Pseudomonadota bacterium]